MGKGYLGEFGYTRVAGVCSEPEKGERGARGNWLSKKRKEKKRKEKTKEGLIFPIAFAPLFPVFLVF
jgi:hypothetical protein